MGESAVSGYFGRNGKNVKAAILLPSDIDVCIIARISKAEFATKEV